MIEAATRGVINKNKKLNSLSVLGRCNLHGQYIDILIGWDIIVAQSKYIESQPRREIYFDVPAVKRSRYR